MKFLHIALMCLLLAGCTGSTSKVVLISCGIISGCETEMGFDDMRPCQEMAKSQNEKNYRTWVCEQRIK